MRCILNDKETRVSVTLVYSTCLQGAAGHFLPSFRRVVYRWIHWVT